MTDISFFHMGCWNIDGCETIGNKESDLNHIVEDIKKKSFDFGIIAGDNVYPKKSKTGNQLDMNVLYNGMQCIKNIGINIYPVLGNHDVVGEDLIINSKESDPSISQCYHMDAQMSDNWIKNNMYAWTKDNSYFIAIDTNILSVVSSEFKTLKQITESITDPILLKTWHEKKRQYENFTFSDADPNNIELVDDIDNIIKEFGLNLNQKININRYQTNTILPIKSIRRAKCYSELKLKQLINISQVEQFLSHHFSAARGKNLFIVGHDPIFSYKKKTIKDKKTGQILRTVAAINNLSDFDFLFQCKPLNKEFYYLCADTHNYQSITLMIRKDETVYKITQIIAGTGGAKPDPIPLIDHMDMGKIYPISDDFSVQCNEIQNSHGYVEIMVNSNNLNAVKINYVPINVIPDVYSLTGTELVGGHKLYAHNKKMYANIKSKFFSS
jgi:hypothetical protein